MPKINLPGEIISYHRDLLVEQVASCQIGVKQDMMEKLEVVISIMEGELQWKESVKLEMIDFLMQLQSALDEKKWFPENCKVKILDVVNAIPEKMVGRG